METRRLRGDQIEVSKILNGYDNIDIHLFTHKKDSRTREHEVKDQCRLDISKYSFSQRTLNEWNKLSTDCVNASSVNMFKNKIDKGYMYMNAGLSINLWLSCPLDIYVSLVKSC